MDIAIANQAEIRFDQTAMTPYFSYTLNGIEHEVWFDDARSMNEKLRLMADRNLYGGAVWQIMNYFPQLWAVMNSLYTIKKREP